MRRFALASLLISGLLACGGSQRSDPRPNLLLVVIDTLRADHLSSYGYPVATSPHIDRLAEGGIRFTNAVSPSSWTRPSVASLFTSRWPSEHCAVSSDHSLSGALPTLAERLRDAGYLTIGISANFVHVTRASGLGRGFTVWHSFGRKVAGPHEESLWTSRAGARMRAPRADEVNRKLLDALPSQADAPLFLYVQYMEPHSPYAPLGGPGGRVASNDYVVDLASEGAAISESERRQLVELYDAEIAEVDRALGELVTALEERGLWQNTVAVITSDHGEEFGEHGGWFHGLTLQAESLRVPLVVHDARHDGAGSLRSDPVDLLDVPTTLLALAGVPAAEGMRGRSLLETDVGAPRPLVAELHPDASFEEHVRRREDRLAVTRWPWKTIVTRDGRIRAYQLERDPWEREALAPAEAPSELVSATRDLERGLAPLDPATQTVPLDESTLEGLRALGYAE